MTKFEMLHRTRLLLHRLGDLRAHTVNSIYDARQLEEMEIAELIVGRDPDIKIDAIRRSVTRTELLVEDVEAHYRVWNESGRSRRDKQIRRIVRRKYFDKQELDDIAKHEKVSKQQALNFLNIGVSELSSRFFGEEGFNYAG
jgi:hypothetical protein